MFKAKGKSPGRPKGRKTTNPNAKKTGPKFRAGQREELKREVAKLSLRGYSQDQIIKRLDFEISQSLVSIFLKEISAEYNAQALESKAEHVSRRLHALREVRKEAWEQWEKSKKGLIRRMSESGGSDKGSYSKEQITKEGRIAYKAFMDIILDTWRDETDLLGFAPVPVKAGDNNVNVFTLDWAALRPRQDDPLAEKIAALESAVPNPFKGPTEIVVRATEGVPAPSQETQGKPPYCDGLS